MLGSYISLYLYLYVRVHVHALSKTNEADSENAIKISIGKQIQSLSFELNIKHFFFTDKA